MTGAQIRVLCIDDNRLMAQALERRLALDGGIDWAGWIEHASDAARLARDAKPDIILLDIDMPGHDAFDLLREIALVLPEARVIMFSGHVRPDYIDRAVNAGAWGYISKNDAMTDILGAIRRVASGEFVLTPDAGLEGPPVG